MATFNVPFKKILVIENEDWEQNKGNKIWRFIKQANRDGAEVRIIERADSGAPYYGNLNGTIDYDDKRRSADLMKDLNWCDVMAFQTTFWYGGSVHDLGMLLAKIKQPKIVIGSGDNLIGNIEKLFSLKELTQLSHHSLFELCDGVFEDWLEKPIDLKPYKVEYDKQEKERITKLHGMPKTGRMVRILTVPYAKGAIGYLKEGMELPELDCSTIDPNPTRGVWVMGNNTPVKLINDTGYNEFEFAELTFEGLTIEFFSMGCNLIKKDIMDTVALWIRSVAPTLKTDAQFLQWSGELCSITGTPRRMYQSIIFNRLKAYAAAHSYFKEEDPRLKTIHAR